MVLQLKGLRSNSFVEQKLLLVNSTPDAERVFFFDAERVLFLLDKDNNEVKYDIIIGRSTGPQF